MNAIKKRNRISEATFLFLSIMFGSIGIFLGMLIFHHKTKKLKFKIGIPLMIIMHIYILINRITF